MSPTGRASRRAFFEVPDEAELKAVVTALGREGALHPAAAARVEQCLPVQRRQSAYILRHFGAHLSIGAVFAFDVIPLPLGTLGRVGWVCGARVRETLRGDRERASVHSARVLLVAAIPLFGYVAYLVPLRRSNRELAWVLANHLWLRRTGRSYEAFVARRSRIGARFARWLVPLPWAEAPGETQGPPDAVP